MILVTAILTECFFLLETTTTTAGFPIALTEHRIATFRIPSSIPTNTSAGGLIIADATTINLLILFLQEALIFPTAQIQDLTI